MHTHKISQFNKFNLFSKILALFFLFIILGQSIVAIDNATSNQTAESEQVTKISLENKIKLASIELDTFLIGSDVTQMIIVTGEKLSVEDKLLFKLIRSQISEASNIPTYSDLEIKTNPSIAEGKTVILLGSYKTNHYSKEIIDKEILVESKESDYNPVMLKYGSSKEGNKILFIYSQKEMINHENRAVKVSPLNDFMDEKYVPIAATLLSIILITLWNLFAQTLIEVGSDYSSEKVTEKVSKKKHVSEAKKLHHQKTLKIHELMHGKELIALITSIVVFAIMLAWSWTDNMINFWNMLVASLIIVTLMSVMKEYIRQSFCYRRRIGVEFKFWTFGTIITAVSTYLGNTFSLASYGLVEDSEEDEKKFGKVAFATSMFTFLISIFAYIANIIYPSLILQLIYLYAILSTFIDMFPMNPMGGNDMRKWSFKTWLILYIIVFICYVAMSFTQYI